MAVYVILLVAVIAVYSTIATVAGAVFASVCGPACLLGGSLPLTLAAVALAALVTNRVILRLPATRITRGVYYAVTVVFYVAVVGLINAVLPW